MTPIHPATRIGHVHYTTANLARQIAFYRDILGFQLHWQDGKSAGLGAGDDDLLRLTEVPNAQQVRGTTGLYHTAFLVPTRWDLAHLLKRIADTGTPIQGMTHHGTHYAIYLPDADGNGIELAWDFPPEQWPQSIGEMQGLSPQEVFSALLENSAEWEGLSAGTTVGHVHLYVANLDQTEHFYREILGFGIPDVFTQAPRQFTETARFFAAGNYHHHIGTNIWRGIGAPPPPADAVGLRYFTVILPDDAALNPVIQRLTEAGIAITPHDSGMFVQDPAQNGLVLQSAG